MEKRICSTCSAINFKKLLFRCPDYYTQRQQFRFPHTKPPREDGIPVGAVEEVIARAAAGCGFCALMLEIEISRTRTGVRLLQGQYPPDWQILLAATFTNSDKFCGYKRRNAGARLFVILLAPDDKEPFPFEDVLTNTSSYRWIRWAPRAREVGEQIDFQTMSDWFVRCQASHKWCQRSIETLSFDKASVNRAQNKLLFAKPEATECTGTYFKLLDVKELRIVQIGEKSYPQYATLSYVWGNGNFCRLTTTNLAWSDDADGKRSVTLPGRVPKSIRDAMLVTAKLGLRYLWVDSLCITQDEPTEKHLQIKEMASIYSNAMICIVAASGEDADAGLQGLHTTTRVVSSTVAVCKGIKLAIPKQKMTLQLLCSHWAGRAWTYQEFLLSRRCLVFTTYEAFFICAESFHRESLQEVWGDQTRFAATEDHLEFAPLTHKMFERASDLETKFHYGKLLDKDLFTRNRALYEYKHLAESYSGKDMKFDSDGLNAFAGISALMGMHLQSPMVCGLPQKYLLEAMSWIPRHRLCRRTEPFILNDGSVIDRTLFPSWSWVAWTGDIRYHMIKEAEPHSEFCILDPPYRLDVPARSLIENYAFENRSGSANEYVLSGILSVFAATAWFGISQASHGSSFHDDSDNYFGATSAQAAIVSQDTEVGRIVFGNNQRPELPATGLFMQLATIPTAYVLVLFLEVAEMPPSMPKKMLVTPSTSGRLQEHGSRLIASTADSEIFKAKAEYGSQKLRRIRALGSKVLRQASKPELGADPEPEEYDVLVARRVAIGKIKLSEWEKAALGESVSCLDRGRRKRYMKIAIVTVETRSDTPLGALGDEKKTPCSVSLWHQLFRDQSNNDIPTLLEMAAQRRL